MATYIEMVKTVRLLCGMQGSGPSSVANAQGVEEVLVRFVRDAYVDVQNLREEWNFLENSDSFVTVAGQEEYTSLEIFGTSTPNIKKHNKDSVYITDSNGKKSYLVHLDNLVLEARYLNSDEQKLPRMYAIEPSTLSVKLRPIPDGVYTVNFRYWEQPEVLTLDPQVPKLPLSFHNLIVYKAVEKMAVYLNSPELYREYATEAARMQGQLMRMDLKKKRMTAGALV